MLAFEGHLDVLWRFGVGRRLLRCEFISASTTTSPFGVGHRYVYGGDGEALRAIEEELQ